VKKTMVFLLFLCFSAALFAEGRFEPVRIKALILPKFEVGEMAGDFPGEAQFYYERYLVGGQEYEVKGGFGGNKLYVKDGVALYVTGMGKVNAGTSTLAILLDPRFDFSGVYVISTGCAGGATERTVMGDVVIASAVADYDLGHHSDPRGPDNVTTGDRTWFHEESHNSFGYFAINPAVVEKAVKLSQGVTLATTEKTKRVMAATFPGQDWAVREPRILTGTVISGDNYWKGEWGQKTAELIASTYNAPGPFMLTEMEDVAIANACNRLGILNRYIVIRDSVNMAVFMKGVTPLSLWTGNDDQLSNDDSVESADIFLSAMKNNFLAGERIIDAILAGTF
jgi:purine nucleoside permease